MAYTSLELAKETYFKYVDEPDKNSEQYVSAKYVLGGVVVSLLEKKAFSGDELIDSKLFKGGKVYQIVKGNIGKIIGEYQEVN